MLANCEADIPPELLLYWMQLRCAQAGADWLDLATPMQQLIDHLYCNVMTGAPAGFSVLPDVPAQAGEYLADTTVAATDEWWLQLAPVDPAGEVVAVQRAGHVLALIRPTAEGRLVVASYRPLDSASIDLLMQLGTHPHPRLGVCMSENNWIYSLDRASSMDNYDAAQRDAVYLSHWPAGWCAPGEPHPEQATGSATATQLAVYYQQQAAVGS